MQEQNITEKVSLPKFAYGRVKIAPPAYTGASTYETEDLNISTLAGSNLEWRLGFTETSPTRVSMINHLGQEIPFKKNGREFKYADKVISSGLYGFRGYLGDSLIYQSDYFQVVATPDQAPKIEPSSKDLYKFHFLPDNKILNIGAKISDDYLVKKVYVVATLARGSGENLKFRELQFPINKSNFKSGLVNKTLDLKALNFAPGDELYYYWAAFDNKTPDPNFSKSDTYFLIYKDTSATNDGELAIMAMNILPEYFRSQRQIIIDTEKLIAKRNKIKKEEFKSASNEIGFDQKSLRIRYGQYLGEEYETNIGGHAHDDSGNSLEGFTHNHDSDEEHDHSGKSLSKNSIAEFLEKYMNNLDKEEAVPQEHNHGNKPQNEGSTDPLADLLAEYIHNHDDAETNTFYEQSTRSLLKASLEQMWQSELYLRLYEPEKALPFEQKALEFLKEAQQKARTYIAKTSYDPPPIKEKETRMKGELKKFNSNYKGDREMRVTETAVLAAEVLGYLNEEDKLNTVQKNKVLALSNLLNKQSEGLKTVTMLMKILNNQNISDEDKLLLKQALKKWALQKETAEKPWAINNKKLENAYWKNLR